MTPNKEHIRLWVDALRSYAYAQGNGYLRQGDNYCCLGVLCEICPLVSAQEDTAIDYIDVDDDSPTVYSYDGQIGILPVKVSDWIGLDSCNPVLVNTDDHYETPLTSTTANDTESMSFETIARLIEEKYLK